MGGRKGGGSGDAGGTPTQRVKADYPHILAALQAHVDASRDWYDVPLDCLWAVYNAWRQGEVRAFARATTTGQFAAGAFGGDGKYFQKVVEQGERIAIPNPLVREGSVADNMRTPELPYPVPPAVAAGLVEAMGLGLLEGHALSSWPATPEGLPLSRIWGRIEAAV